MATFDKSSQLALPGLSIYRLERTSGAPRRGSSASASSSRRSCLRFSSSTASSCSASSCCCNWRASDSVAGCCSLGKNASNPTRSNARYRVTHHCIIHSNTPISEQTIVSFRELSQPPKGHAQAACGAAPSAPATRGRPRRLQPHAENLTQQLAVLSAALLHSIRCCFQHTRRTE